MARCSTCIFFDGKRCMATVGRYYQKKIVDEEKENDCVAYIDNWIAFNMVEERL